MAQTTNDIKNGSVLNLDGQLWTVTKFQHVKPGKGPAFVRTTIKNVLSGKIVDKTFNAGMKMEFETVDNRNLQYSYEDGDNFVFMDMTTYDQVYIPKTLVGDQAKFLLEGTDCVVSFHDGTPLSVELPASVILTITHTEPGLQGNRSNAGTKPASMDQIPPVRKAKGVNLESICPPEAKARRSRSTPATAPTSAARTESKDNRLPWHVPPLAKGL